MVHIYEHVAVGNFVGSLDFSKAFDHVRPSKAHDVLVHHGCPRGLVHVA